MFEGQEHKVSVSTALLLCATTAAATILGCYAAAGWRTDEVEDKLREIDKLVADRYVGELDGQAVADYAAVGYMTGLGDKWSSYIPADQYEAYQLSSQGKGCGIGVTVISGADSIREVIAFPTVKDASDLMTNAPDVVDPVQLEELGIAVVKTEEETTEEA